VAHRNAADVSVYASPSLARSCGSQKRRNATPTGKLAQPGLDVDLLELRQSLTCEPYQIVPPRRSLSIRLSAGRRRNSSVFDTDES